MVKKIIKTFIQILTWLLFALLLFAVYGKVQMMVFKQNYTTFFGYTMFQVASGSMEPTLKIDDVILVKVGKSFEKDDIISFPHKGAIITHRVIDIDGDNITVRGDANNTVDEPIDRNIVIGKVVKVFPELKIWQQTLSDPKILVSLFLTLLLFDFAFSYKKSEKGTEEKKEIKKEKLKEEVKEEKPNKDVIEADELLTLTSKLRLEELNDILRKNDVKKLNHEDSIKFQELKDLNLEKTRELVFADYKKDKISEYTIRLDLKAIQKKISKKMK